MKYLIKIYDMLTILLISMVSIAFGILFEYFGIGCIQFVLYSDEAFDIKFIIWCIRNSCYFCRNITYDDSYI